MNLLETELGELKSELLDMTHLVKEQMEKSITAFYTFDHDLAKEVLKNEKRVNGIELKIDSRCEHILALFNPVAIDLRFVVASLKMVSDLERIGDNAEGLCKFLLMAEKPFDAALIEKMRFKEMNDIVLDMLNVLCESFETDNTKLARTVFSMDEVLDDINSSANVALAEYIQCNTDKDKVMQAIYLLSMIRKTERVGDYITNISEEIIFYVKAKVLKHKKNKE
ncbi:phosphate signaling complex protein PhoU [uncultured Cytophaga sp.]|uniref:phosphate signaling complex protein PhoU n=1 Tax=uncultured Cytophaga sp. TaxID=160238 RepID=UPI0026304461|nr:phosphate signaling complex protein PhoU [uncultured Cytophaga sp.]